MQFKNADNEYSNLIESIINSIEKFNARTERSQIE